MIPSGITSATLLIGVMVPTGAATIAIGVAITAPVPAFPAASENPE